MGMAKKSVDFPRAALRLAHIKIQRSLCPITC